MCKKILMILLGGLPIVATAQDLPVRQFIDQYKKEGIKFETIRLFSFSGNNPVEGGGAFQQLKLKLDALKYISSEQPDAIRVDLPLGRNKHIRCSLAKLSLGNIKFTVNRETFLPEIKQSFTYRGIVENEQNRNFVVLTIHEHTLSLSIHFPASSIQVMKDAAGRDTYRLYNSDLIALPRQPLPDCGTRDHVTAKTDNGIVLDGNILAPADFSSKCVNIFVDCFDSLYYHFNSNTQLVTDYVYELFNLVAAGYFNEQINIQISGINIWTTPDPYRGDSRENALVDLADYWKDNFWGNILVGLDFGTKSRSGLAGDIGRVKATSLNTCPAYGPNVSACCYCDLNYGGSYVNFPGSTNTTPAQIYSIMHETGHLLGAHHTKWCGWKISSNPDTYGAIDSCGAPGSSGGWNYTEGGCAQGPPLTSSGATIMSYCNDAPLFINYNNGFGTLPGNAIRNFIGQSSCIADCSNCFGSLGPLRELLEKKDTEPRREYDWSSRGRLSSVPPSKDVQPTLNSKK